MSRNRKGINLIELIIIIWLILMVIFFVYSNKIKKDAYNATNEILDEYILKIEDIGYLTFDTKIEIGNDLREIYANVKVDGTPEKVMIGEKVILTAEIGKSKFWIREGIAN